LILAINGAQYLRCYRLTGSPLGLPVPDNVPRQDLAFRTITVRGALANTLRNVSLEAGTPSTAVNGRIEQVFRRAIRALGVNPDDPGATFLGEPFQTAHFSLNEVYANNPLHLVLWLVCAGLIFWRERRRSRLCAWLCVGLALSFVLFCATLKWQIWGGRLHLPLFVIASAPIGFVLERHFSRGWAIATGAALLTVGLVFCATNRNRSLIPWSGLDDVYRSRSVLYFSDQHEAAADYLAAAQVINQSGCRQIAIDSYLDDLQIKLAPDSFFVYPLLALIRADGTTRNVWYTDVQNLSSRYAGQPSHPAPCAVVCLECTDVREKWYEYRKLSGRAAVFDDLVVFR